jgi:RNA polymerase subunit RPABC4/transcription elongation factor Spt4
MNPCQNCGKLNTPETNFCRFCGTKFNVSRQTLPDNAYDYSPPRPYAWKTDEFQAENEPRKTDPIGQVQPLARQRPEPNYNYAPLAYPQPQQFARPFRCPNCMSQYPPRRERRISTAGWITFAVLLVVFFPLFWIGLLIKEEVQICQTCNSKLPMPQR